MTDIEKTLKKVTAEGISWYPMKDVAALLGDKNPRQMMYALKEETQERKFSVKDANGRYVPVIHISEGNVLALMRKKGREDDTGIQAVLKSAPEAEQKGVVPEPVVVAPVNDEQTVSTQSPQPKPPARKKKRTINAIKISKEDYASLRGMSLGTVYNHIKKHKLRVMQGYQAFLWITEHDGDYEQIVELLKDPVSRIAEKLEVRYKEIILAE